MQTSKDLISVCVITYNSSKTIIETLDSILAQYYGAKNIQLIISDDSSSDMTVHVIDSWLRNYADCFHDVIFFKNEINGGIPKNINIAWKAAIAPWVKSIAGDDILLPECLDANLKFIKDSGSEICFSKMLAFKDEAGKHRVVKILPEEMQRSFFSLDAKMQSNYLKVRDISGTPSAFISSKLLKMVGYADERFTLIEDLPLWYKITNMGVKIHFLDLPTVKYRLSDSVSRAKKSLINLAFLSDLNAIDNSLLNNNISSPLILMKIRKKIWLKMLTLFIKFANNRKTKINYFIFHLIYLMKPGFPTLVFYKIINKFIISQ